MKTILVLGAGRSSSSLIRYLLAAAEQEDWQVVVGDVSGAAAEEKTRGHARAKAIAFDITNEPASSAAIRKADIVISLIPAHLHIKVAALCLQWDKHLLNASYVSEAMRAMHDEAKKKGLLFLNECGLDPGIDHMSAMQVMDNIREAGGKIISFESFTGGLIAPQTDPGNPWRYKFTWNPRNVVMAGQGTARFLEEGKYKYIPYQQLFKRITQVKVDGYGDYEGYANRDSLQYIETYGLQGIQTMLRGTLRNQGYCGAWNVLVQLGCCDDTYRMDEVSGMTHVQFTESFLGKGEGDQVEEKLARLFGINSDGPELTRLRWSGLFSDELVGLDGGTPAQVLEHILNKKWKLNDEDHDQIVMWHRFRYTSSKGIEEIHATLIATGEDRVNTAMAKTVGLPLGIAAKLLLQGKIRERGVVIPVKKEIYEPVLKELALMGIALSEKHF